MKFTLNWLKEVVAFKTPPEKLAAALTMAGFEVESLTPLRVPDGDGEDWLFEIAVTPNRGDCLGLTGLAREVSTLAGGRLKSPPVSLHARDSSAAKRIAVTIRNPRLCSRYSARIIDGIQIGASPAWMRFRLESCGIRSINNVVDITNYVMLETGQPLHAFDLDRLPTRRIVVRPAGDTRNFVTLDEVERDLDPEDLLICDGEVPIALAGVMGGMNSEVQPGTRSVLLESAHFNPVCIRRTAKRLGLHSEASHRFERGVDPNGTLFALDRAAYLFDKLAGADSAKGVVDRYARRPKSPIILLREPRVSELLGIKVPKATVVRILRSLGLKVESHTKRGALRVVPPSSRIDLTREADLIEEVARLYGYDKIPTTLPLSRPAGGKTDLVLRRERQIQAFLAGEGLAEVINLPFTSEWLNRRFAGLWEQSAAPVKVVNPLVKESAEMRLSLIPGLLENLRFNLAQKADSFGAFHLGKVFRLSVKGQPEERHCLAGLLYGPRKRRGLRSGDGEPRTLLECKGLVEGVLDVLRISRGTSWVGGNGGTLHPGRGAFLHLGDRKAGYLGEIHPDLLEELAIPRSVIFELDFEELVQYSPREIAARSLPRYPSVERDLAVVVDEAFPSQRIISWIQSLSNSLIEDVEVFDEYRGAPVPDGKKSLAYKISYRADDRTLTDLEVNTLHQDLVEQIGKIFGVERRS